MSDQTVVSIAKQFSKFPAGRFVADGPFSGEACRKKLLVPVLQKSHLKVILDGTLGYGSSFLEEAFGGLVRIEGFEPADLRSRLVFESREDPSLVDEIWSYIEDAGRAAHA